MFKKYFKITNLNKKKINTLILIFLIFAFFEKANLFKNIYSVIFKSHNIRFIKAYDSVFFSGYCKKQSHGYVAFIKKNYLDILLKESVPKIINFEKGRKIPYWIFLKTNPEIDNNFIILFNFNLKNGNFDISNYKTINNYQNKCLFLIKND